MACRYTYIGEPHFRRLVDALIKHGRMDENDRDHDYLYLMEWGNKPGVTLPFACVTCDDRFAKPKTEWFLAMENVFTEEARDEERLYE